MSRIGRVVHEALSHPTSAITLASIFGGAATYILAAAYYGGYVRGLGSHPSLYTMALHEAPYYFSLGAAEILARLATRSNDAVVFRLLGFVAAGTMFVVLGRDTWPRLRQRALDVRKRIRRHSVRQTGLIRNAAVWSLLVSCAVIVGWLLCLQLVWAGLSIIVTFERAGGASAQAELHADRLATFPRSEWTDAEGARHAGYQLLCSPAAMVCAIHGDGRTHTVPIDRIASTVAQPLPPSR